MHIPAERRAHVAARLADDPVAWLTTVRPEGMPDTVPVWFVWLEPEFVVYSQPNKRKLHNLARNPLVSLALDDTRGGDDVVRFEGTARIDESFPTGDRLPAYAQKYEPHIQRLGYGDPASFAAIFSVPIVITPTKYRQWA